MNTFGSSSRRRSSRRGISSRPGLAIGGVVLLFGLLIGGCLGIGAWWSHGTEDVVTITVNEKERVANRDDDGSRYMVWTTVLNDDGSTSNEVFEVTDDGFQLEFNAADTYGQLRVDGTYTVKVNGKRSGFFSMNRNILEIIEVVERPAD